MAHPAYTSDTMTDDELIADGFAPAIALKDLAPGSPTLVALESASVLIIQNGQGTRAFNALCPHQLGNLADGVFADGCITCPVHDYVFDVATGECTRPDDALRLRHYPTHEHNGALWIKVPRAKWRS